MISQYKEVHDQPVVVSLSGDGRISSMESIGKGKLLVEDPHKLLIRLVDV